MTPRELVQLAIDQFNSGELYYGHGTDNAADEAAFIVLRALGLPFDVEQDILDTPVTNEQASHVRQLINKRIHSRIPAAYLLGEAWFAGLPFHVDESVLVPRSPLAELILDGFRPWCNPGDINRILDIGTGSGCIAIACASVFPEASVDATDISTQALAVAEKNVKRHGLGDRVTLIHSDLYTSIDGIYDLIISNPPYVDSQDMSALPDEYQHEPELGLFGGPDGLQYVCGILENAVRYLNEKGVLILEVGNGQEKLQQRFPEVPFIWLEFEHGGDGVFLLTRDELVDCFPVT